MEITFSKIIPVPIPEKDILQSEIWDRDFILKTGDKVLVFAESGKGKTTFINIILGNRKDYTGELLINGKNIRNFSLSEISRLRKEVFSIVPQGLSLFYDLTVIENIQMKNKIQNFYSYDKILNMLEVLGLKDFENRKTETLSFGQKQRVAIIRALCQSYDFLLLDEAFSHIDTKNAEIAWKLINKEVETQNAGVILTSLHESFDIKLKKIRV